MEKVYYGVTVGKESILEAQIRQIVREEIAAIREEEQRRVLESVGGENAISKTRRNVTIAATGTAL